MISTFTNAEYLALAKREVAGEIRVWSVNVLPHNRGYRVDWCELPAKAAPTASPAPAMAIPESVQTVTAKIICHDCQTEHDLDKDCPICAPLHRAMIANRKLRRDRQMDRQFKKGVDV